MDVFEFTSSKKPGKPQKTTLITTSYPEKQDAGIVSNRPTMGSKELRSGIGEWQKAVCKQC